MIKTYKPVSNKAVIESAIAQYNDRINESKIAEMEKEKERNRAFKESENFYTMKSRGAGSFNRFNTFTESITHALLSDCIYHVYKGAMRESLVEQPNITGMMRAMVGEFVKEDASDILFKMRNKTAVLSEMYNLITDTKKKILESDSLDKNDPSTFTIGKDIKDEFYEKLDSMDTESISDAIRDRVSDAINSFMIANREDHDRIIDTLQLTKDKLEEAKNQPEEVKESYEHLSKRHIAKIRNRKKGVFESMVMAMSESVMKDDNLREEFAEGAKLNMPKIVDRIETMYTFIETANTMKLCNVDEEYLQSVISDLRK